MNPLDMGMQRATLRPCHQTEHGRLFSDGHRLNPPVAEIAHPAHHAELPGLVDHGRTIADALDAAFDNEVTCNAIHVCSKVKTGCKRKGERQLQPE